jgi:hypothetical protein
MNVLNVLFYTLTLQVVIETIITHKKQQMYESTTTSKQIITVGRHL